MKEDQRSGFTIVELMVSMSLIGVLLGLLLPAVQQARASARKLECKNRMRQIGIALANAQSTTGLFPSSSSAFVELLPYLEESVAYAKATDSRMGEFPHIPHIEAYRCPSETIVHDARYEQVPNYRFNSGTMFPIFYRKRYNGFRVAGYSALGWGRKDFDVRPGDIKDGLSQTAALSERLVTRGGANYLEQFDVETLRRETGRYPWPTETMYAGPGNEQAAVDQCRHHRMTPRNSDGGITPSVRNMYVGYDHLLPPNHVACVNGPDPSYQPGGFTSAMIPPSSLHHGGVNVLFADGSVHFIANEIDLKIWNAIGTRNGSETIQF